ncbi:unnamed protein product [Phytophthora fragariaefolia]|uniref:Unnamed protein product n=1 Tax=Phytophthora fragariaefolia TaxID=1490495 RepID=A0A9W6WZM9_9STRA|nr:unnamed protein product [Phytophthora fragariaefolia]
MGTAKRLQTNWRQYNSSNGSLKGKTPHTIGSSMIWEGFDLRIIGVLLSYTENISIEAMDIPHDITGVNVTWVNIRVISIQWLIVLHNQDQHSSNKSCQEVISWIDTEGNGVPTRAEKHFRDLELKIDGATIRKWYRDKEKIMNAQPHQRRLLGGGRKPLSMNMEDMLYDLVFDKRLRKEKVTWEWIADQALVCHASLHADDDAPPPFAASQHWVSNFMARAHISRDVKAKCQSRGIEMCVIPGGFTPYQQAGDIAIYRSFKDILCGETNAWKESGGVRYTRGRNPRPPAVATVCGWIRRAWRDTDSETVINSITAAGFSENPYDWFIARHDVYGERFLDSWVTSDAESETDTFNLGEIEDALDEVTILHEE